MRLRDRTYAAFLLAEKLGRFKDTNSVVLAVPRGGVPVGYQIANSLYLPLEIVLCKKIGHPTNPEFAIGAVSPGHVDLDPEARKLPKEYILTETRRIREELESKRRTFMRDEKPLDLGGKNAIIVDDGIATGRTLIACIEDVRKKNPARIIIAAPVASSQAVARLTPLVDDITCLTISRNFESVGQFYEHFPQVSDEEVKTLLEKARTADGERVST